MKECAGSSKTMKIQQQAVTNSLLMPERKASLVQLGGFAVS